MASSYNFTFDNLSRIGDDVCGISERDIKNQQIWQPLPHKTILKILWS